MTKAMKKTKKILHWLGGGFAVAGVGFITQRLIEYGDEIEFSRISLEVVTVITMFVVVFAIASVMLSLGWSNLLEQFGAKVTYRHAIRVSGITQLAKYVPGNIFHVAGRQAMGMASGVPGWALAKSAGAELALIAASGGLFGLLALPLVVPKLPLDVATLIFFLAVGSTAVVLGLRIGPPTARAFGWYAGFLLTAGLIFSGLIELLVEGQISQLWLPAAGAYVFALLIGLVTPGAPAGVGVREMVLLFFLGNTIGEADLLLGLVLSRVVTVLGDVGFFAIAMLTKERAT